MLVRFLVVSKESIITPQGGLGGIRAAAPRNPGRGPAAAPGRRQPSAAILETLSRDSSRGLRWRHPGAASGGGIRRRPGGGSRGLRSGATLSRTSSPRATIPETLRQPDAAEDCDPCNSQPKQLPRATIPATLCEPDEGRAAIRETLSRNSSRGLRPRKLSP